MLKKLLFTMLLAMSIQYANAQTITLNIGENGPDEYGLEIHTYTYDSYHTLMQYNGEYLTSVHCTLIRFGTIGADGYHEYNGCTPIFFDSLPAGLYDIDLLFLDPPVGYFLDYLSYTISYKIERRTENGHTIYKLIYIININYDLIPIDDENYVNCYNNNDIHIYIDLQNGPIIKNK